jgi:hypothetical protein
LSISYFAEDIGGARPGGTSANADGRAIRPAVRLIRRISYLMAT